MRKESRRGWRVGKEGVVKIGRVVQYAREVKFTDIISIERCVSFRRENKEKRETRLVPPMRHVPEIYNALLAMCIYDIYTTPLTASTTSISLIYATRTPITTWTWKINSFRSASSTSVFPRVSRILAILCA